LRIADCGLPIADCGFRIAVQIAIESGWRMNKSIPEEGNPGLKNFYFFTLLSGKKHKITSGELSR
jgi:hypothetical protein